VTRFPDFSHFSQQKTLKKFIDDEREIYQTALSILDQINIETLGVRLIGVSVSNLIKGTGQLSLLKSGDGSAGDEWGKQALLEAMDEINDRYGESTLTWGRLLLDRVKIPHILSPAWRPYKHLKEFKEEDGFTRENRVAVRI
jgi:DNA polymerase-4